MNIIKTMQRAYLSRTVFRELTAPRTYCHRRNGPQATYRTRLSSGPLHRAIVLLGLLTPPNTSAECNSALCWRTCKGSIMRAVAAASESLQTHPLKCTCGNHPLRMLDHVKFVFLLYGYFFTSTRSICGLETTDR